MEELSTRAIDPLVSVRSKEVTLRLAEVGGEALAAPAVEVGEGSAKRRGGDAEGDRRRDSVAPALLAAKECLSKEVVHQEVVKVGVALKGRFDIAEEFGAYDTSTPPHKGNAAVVELPLISIGGRLHEEIALRVADDLRSVERRADRFCKLCRVPLEGGPPVRIEAACLNALVLQR